MPQHQMVIPHYMGRSKGRDVGSTNGEGNSSCIKRQDSFKSSLQDIPLLLPQEAEGLDGSQGSPKANGLDSSTGRSVSFTHQKAKTKLRTTDMPMKSFVDEHNTPSHQLKASLGEARTSDLEWWETQDRGNLVGSADEVGPRTSCRCQVG